MFGVSSKSRGQALGEILSAHTEEREESANLVVAALYFIYTDGVSGLGKKIKHLIEEAEDPFVRETSMWVSARLGLSNSS
jgi:hypothetical protein